MLILTAQNVSRDSGNTVADYEVKVRVNEKIIWEGKVSNHVREDGWAQLIRRIAWEADRG